MKQERVIFADDDTEPVGLLFRLRLPSLVIGLLLGILLSFATSRFEEVLAKHVSVAFFIPFIMYLAAAVGTQTQTIYARDVRAGRANFKKYLMKESMLGILFGLLFAAVTAPIVLVWLQSKELAVAVSVAMFGAVAAAPLIALVVTEVLRLERTDPAVGAGPLATAIQDTLSILIYGFIASAIIL